MKRKEWCCCGLAAACILSLVLTGCGNQETAAPPGQQTGQQTGQPAQSQQPVSTRDTRTTVLLPEQRMETVYENDRVCLDASSTGEGYILVRYSGEIEKIKLQLTMPDTTVYTYTLKPGDFEVFPLSGGDGTYCVDVYENAYDKMYALAFSQEISVTLNDPFRPFLYPNQYVWYTQDSKVCGRAMELSRQSADDLDYVTRVYEYIIGSVDYDQELAETVPTGYLPDVDRTMDLGTGICFDYAALMTALLRLQGVPTRLVVGYSGQQYHAWIDVYLDQIGWVDNIIYFDGVNWALMDPTLGANHSDSSVKRYLGDGSNYLAKYHY